MMVLRIKGSSDFSALPRARLINAAYLLLLPASWSSNLPGLMGNVVTRGSAELNSVNHSFLGIFCLSSFCLKVEEVVVDR